jgi:ubiquinone/menaquinone biosynthesis C-methylase UbiE
VSDEDHKTWVAGVFDRAARTYDRVGEPYHDYFAGRLVQLLDPLPHEDLLDVGCGRGAVLAHAAGRVAHLVGIDVSPAMVSAARAELVRAGVAHPDVRVMDAEQLDIPDASFDVVTCAFALFFLPDAQRAAGEFARVVRPGGRVIVSTWGEPDPRWAWEDELMAAVDVRRRAVARPFDRPADVADLLAGAGFGDLRSECVEHEIRFADPEQWWAWKWSFSLRGVLEQLDPDALETLRVAMFAGAARMADTAGLPMRLRAWCTLGRKRGSGSRM